MGAPAPDAASPAAAWSRAGDLYQESRLTALGCRHGVTTRALGSMKDAANRRRAAAAAGLDAEPGILHQVHGTKILEAPGPAGAAPPAADGWVCRARGLVPGVYVADCIPLFVWDVEGTAAGVFHAGWRGLAAGMPGEAVGAFRRWGLGPERLAAAVGPHVGACCYRVGPEVARRFRPEVLADGRVDLGAEARLQLFECGVAEAAVTVSSACTACRPLEFFSYRREKRDQRMLAFISLPEGSHVVG